MKKCFGIVLPVIALALTGCGGGKGDGGGGGGDGAGGGSRTVPGPALGCLNKAGELQASRYSGADLAAAFAVAGVRCGAGAADVRARALEMERNGTTIEQEPTGGAR